MKRKKWLGILAALSCCCCLLGVGACGDEKQKAALDLTSLELTTQKPLETESMFVENPKTQILVGSCIDIEDYIVQHKDSLARAVQFRYTDKDGSEQTVTVKGLTYYPTVSGKYTLIYTEQFADRILRDSMEITVYSPQPEVSVSPLPLYYSKGSTVRLRLLLNNANPYCEASSDFQMESVSYCQYEVNLEETVKEDSKKTTDLTGATQFTFDEYGSYLFTFFTEVDGLRGYGNVRVEVVEQNHGNEDTLMNEDDTYASGNVQTNGDIVRLVQAEYSSASYLVLEEDYYDQDVLRVEFKGKNAPNIGLLTVPNERAENPYNLVSGQGYTLSFENTYVDMFSIWGYGVNYSKGEGRFGGMNLHNGNSVTGYWGRNHFENDKYYLVETRLDTASVDELLSVFYLNIYEIENYGTAERSYKKVYTANVPAGETKEGKIEKGKIVFYSSAKEDVTFKYYKPVGRVKDFTLNGKTVSWAPKEGALGYLVSPNGLNYEFQTATSYTLNNYVENLTPLFVKPIVDDGFMYVDEVAGFNPAEDKSRIGTSKLQWTELDAKGKEVTKKGLADGSAVFNKYVPAPTEAYTGNDFEGSKGVTFAQETGLDVAHASVTVPFISAVEQNYVITKNTYGDGTFVAMEFIGSKHPSYVLFGVQENGKDTHSAVGAGIDLDTNTFGTLGYYKADVETERRPTQDEKGEAIGCKATRLTRGYFKSFQQGGEFGTAPDFPAAAVTKYLLVIGAKQESENVKIQYYLYGQTGVNMWLQYEAGDYEIPNATLQEGKISVRSSCVVAGHLAEFKMYKPDTFENLSATLENIYTFDRAIDVFDKSAGATVSTNEDGFYQLNLPMVAGKDNECNYVATKQTYGSGTYLMAEFTKETQNSIPSMILFGVDNVATPPTFVQNTGVGYGKQQTTWNGVGVCTDKWNKIVAFYHKAASGTASYVTQPDVQPNVTFCRRDDDLGSRYVLIIGAENVGADVKIEYTLYEKEGTTLTFVETFDYTYTNASVSNGSIVFVSPHYGSGSVVDIKLWTIGTKTEVQTKLNSKYTVNP